MESVGPLLLCDKVATSALPNKVRICLVHYMQLILCLFLSCSLLSHSELRSDSPACD